MTFVGYDAHNDVYHWKDEKDGTIHYPMPNDLNNKGRLGCIYGLLCQFTYAPVGNNPPVLIPVDKQGGIGLYLIDPRFERYEILPDNERVRVFDKATGETRRPWGVFMIWNIRVVNPIGAESHRMMRMVKSPFRSGLPVEPEHEGLPDSTWEYDNRSELPEEPE
jgi:hypothetical protein